VPHPHEAVSLTPEALGRRADQQVKLVALP
jgi:hypothetical protein